MFDVLPACECGAPLHDGPHEEALAIEARLTEEATTQLQEAWRARKAMLGDMCVCDDWLASECDCYSNEPECPCSCHDDHGGPVA